MVKEVEVKGTEIKTPNERELISEKMGAIIREYDGVGNIPVNHAEFWELQKKLRSLNAK